MAGPWGQWDDGIDDVDGIPWVVFFLFFSFLFCPLVSLFYPFLFFRLRMLAGYFYVMKGDLLRLAGMGGATAIYMGNALMFVVHEACRFVTGQAA